MNSLFQFALRSFASLLLTGFFSVSSLAQPPDTLWTKTFGGPRSDEGLSVQQTADEGFIIAGGTFSFSNGDLDVCLVKTNASGNLQWLQHLGGINTDWGGNAKQTTDGGYIVAGYTNSFGAGSSDVYLVKTDALGNPIWQQTYGGLGDDKGKMVQPTNDGGYVIVGWTSSYGSGGYDIYLVKTDSLGNLQWEQTFGNSGDDQGMSVQQTPDTGYIIVGWSAPPSSFSDICLIKADSTGTLQWQQTYGGNLNEISGSIELTADGGFVIAGATTSLGGGVDFYLLKIDELGNLQWEQTYGASEDDWGWYARQTCDGGFVIVGVTASYGAGMSDVYLVKTDTLGNLEWSSTYGGSEPDEGLWVLQTTDGGYIISGATWSFGAGDWDIYLIRLESDLVFVKPTSPAASQQLNELKLETPRPNPFNPTTILSFELRASSYVKLEVFDINGRAVGAKHFPNASPASGSGTTPTTAGTWYPAGSHQITFDGTDLPSGLYFAKLTAGDFSQVQKLVLLK